jgi:hypothetical protein
LKDSVPDPLLKEVRAVIDNTVFVLKGLSYNSGRFVKQPAANRSGRFQATPCTNDAEPENNAYKNSSLRKDCLSSRCYPLKTPRSWFFAFVWQLKRKKGLNTCPVLQSFPARYVSPPVASPGPHNG